MATPNETDVDALVQAAICYDNAGKPEKAQNNYLSACELLLAEARTLQSMDANSADKTAADARDQKGAGGAATKRLELLRAKADVLMERVAWHQQHAAEGASVTPPLSDADTDGAAVAPFGCGAFFLRLAVMLDHPRTRAKSLAAYEISVAAFLQVLRAPAGGASQEDPRGLREGSAASPALPPPEFALTDAERAAVSQKVRAVLDHMERLHAASQDDAATSASTGGGSAGASASGGQRGASVPLNVPVTRPVVLAPAGVGVRPTGGGQAKPAVPPVTNASSTPRWESTAPSGAGPSPAAAGARPSSTPPGGRCSTPGTFSPPSRAPASATAPPGSGGPQVRPPAPPPVALASPQPPKYTERELQVLRQTSRIGGKVYLPWMEGDGDVGADTARRPQPAPEAGAGSPGAAALFTDPDGLLPLSQKQRRHFGAWRRPSEIVKLAAARAPGMGGGIGPCLIQHVSAFAVTQTLVSDCSFVSSLAVTAAYERRFHKRLITSRLFPQDAAGVPLFNPQGKYVAKLFFNGIWRRVLIDDLLPTSAGGDLLCSFSSNRREFWVSLLEKAYLKVAGGYDFPGSTSEVDLYALTGWIPECIAIKDSTRPFLPDKIWARMRDGHYMGQALMTVSTGPLSDQEESMLGLVRTHAYALLDVREVSLLQGGQRASLRMLQLKNPWCEVRWKGAYSAADTMRWTPALRQALAYDAAAVALEDNGVFWIDWESFLRFFANIHFNWNPFLFRPPATMHSYWPASGVPQSDMFSLGECPQFAVTVQNQPTGVGAVGSPPKPVSLWLLLSKHITDRSVPNEDFLALHVFAPASPSDVGKRVYYPDTPLVKGVYVNSEHRLVRVDVPPAPPPGVSFVVVVSQVRRPTQGGVAFTLRCHCEAGVAVAEIPMGHPFECPAITGQWAPGSRGVAAYFLDITRTTEIVAQLQVSLRACGRVAPWTKGPDSSPWLWPVRTAAACRAMTPEAYWLLCPSCLSDYAGLNWPVVRPPDSPMLVGLQWACCADGTEPSTYFNN
eukprot:jgi/Mesvir1/17967/Mv22635-RA.3